MNMSALPHWRIGITQRHLPETQEVFARDALDTAWSNWFIRYWPAARFLSIPNFSHTEQAIRYFEQWGLNALILSGGEDLGSSPVRDAIEATLLAYARNHKLPVLGVCRGMQMLHAWSGGVLVQQPGHVGAPHGLICGTHRTTVNSWHRFVVPQPQPDWHSLAVCDDGSIEAMQHASLPWLGLMWHPERVEGVPDPMWQWLTEVFSPPQKPYA